MKSKSSELLDKSIAAMISAIEIYNKPDFLYRGETFSILAINGWELLFKAKYLKEHNNKIRSLYVTEPVRNKDGSKSKRRKIKLTRSGNPFTHSIDYIAEKLISAGQLDRPVWDNLQVLIELRDSSIHFYNYSTQFNCRIQEIGTATLRNYVVLYKKWFSKDLSKYNFYLMPLSFMKIPKDSNLVLLNSEEKNFFKFTNELEERNANTDGEYSVALNTTVRFTKSTSKDEIKVVLSRDEDAIKVNLTDAEIRDRYPFDYATLTEKCKKRYVDFVANNQYHKNRRLYENDTKYAYIRYLDPQNPKSGRKVFYNSGMLSKLDQHYTKKSK
jgi:hypothetical protein